MIKQLRRKFVLIMMSIVSLILLAVFCAVMLTTRQNLERNSLGALNLAIREFSGQIFHPQGPGGLRDFDTPGGWKDGKKDQPQRTPTLTAEAEADGTVRVLHNRIHFIADSEVEELVRRVLATEKSTGVLSDANLRYFTQQSGQVTHIAFADISMEREITRGQVRNSLLIGGGALLVFLLLSLFLANWAVRPVQEAWDRQKQFVADASHELKTPLTVILSNADMLGRSRLEEKDAKRLDNILAEGGRMKRLIGDLLTLARSDNGQIAPILAEVDFSDTVNASILSFEAPIFDDGKELDYEVAEGLSVTGDGGKLRQLVDILLDNAQKYCVAGGKITVRLEKGRKATARLSVTNQGEPIPQEELEAIFQRFYRLDRARANHGGFGLGLSIARTIVEEHGGKIWAESNQAGNSFHVEL